MEALIKEAQKLFSSKKNAGKSVNKLTDKLHAYKQTLLLLSIALLLGYSQFRSHFQCKPSSKKLDPNLVTDFCWLNGTITLTPKDSNNLKSILEQSANSNQDNPLKSLIPHVGMQYKFNDGKFELTNHNYMRSLWALLILMAACSYIAQRSWSSIFNNDVLKAILKLPGNEELPIVKTAQEKKPLEVLTAMREQQMKEKGDKAKDPLTIMINLIESDLNEHNHTLDYYINQMIYLLLVKRTTAYKLSSLRLRRKLIIHSLLSFILTLNQFTLPWLFIGNQYLFYGYQYAQCWIKYLKDQFEGKNTNINTIDYELSAKIWPTMTTCEYIRTGVQGIAKSYVPCIVGINEICGKMFAVIWWLVVINIAIEAFSLISTLCCSFGVDATRDIFGTFYWPNAKKQARAIATFRYARARLLSKQSKLEQQQLATMKRSESVPTSALEKKQLELEAEKRDSNNSLRTKKWYLWCSRDIGLFLRKQGKRVYCFSSARGRNQKEADRFYESREELNVYYLLYLLYLRLQCSSKKTSRIITLIGDALNIYLEHLRKQLYSSAAATLPAMDKQLLTSFGEAGTEDESNEGRKSEWLTEALTVPMMNQQNSKSSLTVFEDPESEGR